MHAGPNATDQPLAVAAGYEARYAKKAAPSAGDVVGWCMLWRRVKQVTGWLWPMLAALGVVLMTSTAHGTKPCPTPLCEPNDAACWERHASWIAVGVITDLERRPTGRPFTRDFAEFVLRVSRWEKTQGGRQPQELSMRVGWCTSGKQLPEDTVGTFRFYGEEMEARPHGQGRVAVDYLTYLRVSCPKPTGCRDEPPKVDPDTGSTDATPRCSCGMVGDRAPGHWVFFGTGLGLALWLALRRFRTHVLVSTKS